MPKKALNKAFAFYTSSILVGKIQFVGLANLIYKKTENTSENGWKKISPVYITLLP